MVYLSKRYPWAAEISSILAAICLLAIPVVFYIALIFSTPWAVACYTYVSWRIMRHRKNQGFQFSLAQLLGAVTWFGGYCSAWRVAYLIVLEEYSRLPTQAPQECYICTAAARGHRRFVCSEEYRTNSGTIRLVNDQLRRFKAFELLLLTICPRLHRLCRKIYDAIGPLATRAIARPLPADFAYVTLKPLEWLCLAAVGLAAKDRSISDNLYRIR
jgi:hypothetical protein